jgi:hypothetical protein
MRPTVRHFYIVFLALCLNAHEAALAGGLFGDLFQSVGNATGVRGLRDFGRNIDEEHRRFKDANPAYKRTEEELTRLARLPQMQMCLQAFDAVVLPVRMNCSKLVSQSSRESRLESVMIQDALQTLLSASVITQADIQGVNISWCQGDFAGSGIAPSANEIVLNKKLKESPIAVATTLAHEIMHVRQYRRARTQEDFKCDYAVKFIACGGCQDKQHSLEREAIDFEERAARALSNQGYQFRLLDVTPNGEVRSAATTFSSPYSRNAVPGTNTSARRAASSACTTARSTASYDSLDCIVRLETVLAGFKMDLNPSVRPEHLALSEKEVADGINEIANDPDVVGSIEDACGATVESGGTTVSLNQSQLRSCTNDAKAHFRQDVTKRIRSLLRK